jgi:transcriptional regulator
MYTPPHNRQDDPDELFAFMREFSFATLVTCGDRGMTATHLPLTIWRDGGSFRIAGHVARANPQAAQLASGAEVLAIFAAPHAYVSPSHYEPGKWVPTWNYVAVHAYGTPTVLDGREAKLAVLRDTIAAYEPGYQADFDSYPPEFVDAKLKGIVAFDIPVSRFDARWKLSQDRKPVERERIRQSLRASDDALAARLAAFMEPPGAVVR